MSADTERIFEISPNISLSARGAVIFYLSLVLATVLVSGTAAVMGYWPVLPFAGFELLVLGIALYLVQRRGRYKEVLRIGEETIVVEKGENAVRERLEFVRHWARVDMERRPDAALSRLVISGQGQRCEIGECLTESEREGLARRLATFIGPVNASPPLLAAGSERDPR